MTRFLAALIWLATTLTAAAQDLMAEPVRPADLKPAERRTLQAALTLTGDYNGLTDGVWGRGTQAALEAYVQRTAGHLPAHYADLAPLLETWIAEADVSGWGPMDLPGGGTILVPWNLLAPDDGGYSTASGDLFLMVTRDDLATATEAHRKLLATAARGTDPYRITTELGIVTVVETPGGVQAWMRSEPVARDGYVSVGIFASGDEVPRMSLIAGSFGQSDDFGLPQTGILAGVLEEAPLLSDRGDAPLGRPGGKGFGGGAVAPDEGPVGRPGRSPFPGQAGTPQPAPRPAPEARAPAEAPPEAAGAPDSSGTGFFIGPETLLTADHVTATCRRIALADGTPVRLRATDKQLDLAVLAVDSSAARDRWLSIQPEHKARLGEEVFALGYPYLGLMEQGLTVTGGNVSALAGLQKDRMMVSAPIQPGNSGGPLVNRRGEVVGVVVSRLDDLAVLEATGTLPQNMNFATPPAEIAGFLDRSGITLPAPVAAPFDLGEGLPDEMAGAVVPVYCYE